MNKKQSTLLTWIFVLIVAIVVGFFIGRIAADQVDDPSDTQTDHTPAPIVSNFHECDEAGYSIMESYPRQCRDSAGNLYTENIGNAMELSDQITIASPIPNSTVSSPLMVSGEARAWYFEATFSLRLEDANGDEIATGYAEAQGDWMVDAFVPYEGQLTFANQPTGSTGTLYLEKANPSGMPANDETLEVPVVF